ncbi:MAG: alternative ribosome rescue aminoacyl-tRNA hydrolase ArfB [Burkholderiaceae bacterium]|jgi:ribosome-associated protein
MHKEIELKESEVILKAIRAQGPGGQHVNKVSSAIHLRFDIHASSLGEVIKQRMLALKDSRISKEGVLVMKVQDTRSQDMNRILAWARLNDLILKCAQAPKARRATQPKRSSIEKRLEQKKKRSTLKSSRGFMNE